jgi:hypothetical protein
MDSEFANGSDYQPYLGNGQPALRKCTVSTSRLLAALDAPKYQPQPVIVPVTKQNKTSTIGPETPKRKRQRKTKDVDLDAPVPEKRNAIFKKKCPQNILERVERVISQRYAFLSAATMLFKAVEPRGSFFMIDRRRNGQELREEFSVLGSTGNVCHICVFNPFNCLIVFDRSIPSSLERILHATVSKRLLTASPDFLIVLQALTLRRGIIVNTL